MKFLVMFIILALLAAGGFFLFTQMSKPATQANSNQSVSCTTGVEGNTGNNYCSNTHSTSSKCAPGLPNTYSDGCTK